MKQSSKQSNKPHEGELLKRLYEWSGLTKEDFTDKFGRKRHWFLKATKDEIVPLREKYKITRAFHIPLEYFDGKFVLPVKLPVANEPQGEYSTPYKMMEEENRQLRKEMNELQKKYIDLLEKFNTLLEQKKEPA